MLNGLKAICQWNKKILETLNEFLGQNSEWQDLWNCSCHLKDNSKAKFKAVQIPSDALPRLISAGSFCTLCAPPNPIFSTLHADPGPTACTTLACLP